MSKDYALAILFSLASNMLTAQYQRADQLPFARGEIFFIGNDRGYADEQGRIYFRKAMVDIPNKKTYNHPPFVNPGQESVEQRAIYSPNHRYKVITYFDAWNYPAKKGSRKPPKADWYTYTMALDWESNQQYYRPFESLTREYYEENFTLAITSSGKLITTDPGKITDVRGPHEPGIKHINGLYLLDLRTGNKTTITTDKIDTRNVFNQWYFLSKDESSIIIVLSRKIATGITEGEVISYNINTGAKTGFTSKGSLLPALTGNNILLTYDYSRNTDYSHELKVFRINDGKVLAEVGMTNEYEVLQFDIRGDSVFYFNKENFTLATFIPGKDELELHSTLPIDTVNLGFAPIDYNLTVLNNQFALVPTKEPKDHWIKKEYSGYLVLFDRKHASPQFAVKPFFHDPQTAINAMNAKNREDREKCERLKKETPFAYGTILVRKTGSGKSPHIFQGADCRYDNYTLSIPGSTLILHYYLHELKDFEALGSGSSICYACSGNGTITESFTSADDGWKQTNFNVYVRIKGKTKTETITSQCKKCLGKGYHKK